MFLSGIPGLEYALNTQHDCEASNHDQNVGWEPGFRPSGLRCRSLAAPFCCDELLCTDPAGCHLVFRSVLVVHNV